METRDVGGPYNPCAIILAEDGKPAKVGETSLNGSVDAMDAPT